VTQSAEILTGEWKSAISVIAHHSFLFTVRDDLIIAGTPIFQPGPYARIDRHVLQARADPFGLARHAFHLTAERRVSCS
jgi:hypothetical protein